LANRRQPNAQLFVVFNEVTFLVQSDPGLVISRTSRGLRRLRRYPIQLLIGEARWGDQAVLHEPGRCARSGLK